MWASGQKFWASGRNSALNPNIHLMSHNVYFATLNGAL